MLSQGSLSLEDKIEEDIIGFHVLSDGSFFKVHNNQHIEIRKGSSTTFIKIDGVASHLSSVSTQIVELPDEHIALAYCGGGIHNASYLAILDLKNGTCITGKAVNDITSLSALSDGSFLLNSDTICFYHDNDLVMKQADQFIRYHMSDIGARYLALPDKSGFIYFDSCHQSTIKMITNQFEEKAERQLAPAYSNVHTYKRNAADYPSYWSSIAHIVPLSHDKFACIELCQDKLDFKYSRYLHVFNTNLVCSYERTLYHIKPQQLFGLNQDHVAVVGRQKGKDDHKIFVKIFDAKGKKVKKITIDKDIENNYIAVTSDGQWVICSKTGEITIHHIFTTLTEKLTKETESVLTGNKTSLPKVLVSIITDYAGFFARNSKMPKNTFPKNTFKEVSYPDERPSLFSRLRGKF